MTIGTPGDGQTFDINGQQFGLTTPGLVPGPIGTIFLAPSSRNFIADFDFQINLDECLCHGLWARLDLPIVMAQTNLGLGVCSDQSTPGTFPEGTFSTDCSTTVASNSISSALQGDFCGKFSNKRLTKWGVAGIHIDLGYDFVRKILNDNKKLDILGDGTQSKSYIYVSDVLNAMRTIQENHLKGYSYFNVGTKDHITVSEIADIVVSVMDKNNVEYKFAGGDRGWKGDVPVVRINSDKIRNKGWSNEHSTSDAIRLSVESIYNDALKNKFEWEGIK